ncbi:MAG: ankyrin repeat domain-containing protein [Acidobacteria bacterium]|nr:ankyrin repeat domain-containing protein [Acidobacteriota bacterium]
MNRRRLAACTALALGAALAVGAAAASASESAGDASLADAAEQGRAGLVRVLVDGGADVNATQVDGMTALHWAAYHEDAATARLLVRAGADADAGNRYGVRPLALAATNANADIVRLLLEAGADANAALLGGETVLMTAARTGSLKAVHALLAHGADPDARERRGQTALMWAAAEGHTGIVHSLVEAGADIQASLTSGFTPLFFAVREGHIDVVETLLDAGVDVNAPLARVKDGPDEAVNNASYRPVDDGMSPLLLAVRNGHFELAVALIEAGADPNDQRTGFSPLHTMSWVRKPDASDRGDPPPDGSGNLTSLQFVRTLAELGADVNARLQPTEARAPHTASRLGVEGATAFLMAADRADTPLMELLLELGADPFLPNADGSTPLMAAAGLGTSAPEEEAGSEEEAGDAVRLLLHLGADIDAVNAEGDTAMHGAAYGSFPTVVQILADYGADIEVWSQPNEQGRTPLFIAEGYRGGLPRPSRPTIQAITTLMVGAGVPTDGPRPELIDMYSRPVPEPAPAKPVTPAKSEQSAKAKPQVR